MTPVEFRRHLHAHPERSFAEHDTAAFIAAQLDALGIEHRRVAGTGVLARIRGRATAAGDRRAVVLRADIDALPIAERTGLPYASCNEGVMHACGHDMHAAVLYGVLREAAAAPDFAGTLLGLFQPGEECNPGGASLVLAEGAFDDFEVVAVVGEHAEPQLEVGTLGFRAGKYMAANDELRFAVRGTGGHGALRAQLHDPVAAAAELIGRLLTLNAPERVLSIGRVEAPGATNVVPDEVRMEGTLRTFDEGARTEAHRAIEDFAAETDARHGTRTEAAIDRGYPSVVNDPALTELAAALAETSGLRVERLPLRPTAEDFGHYTLRYPSLFYRLGVGAAAGRLHTATFAPDERALDVGIDFMLRLARRILESRL
jgi:amidohydrolase